MRWMSWICAPRPTKLSRSSARARQPELLEPRLVLSHAPLGDFGPGSGQDVASLNATANSTAVYGAPSPNNLWSDDGSMELGGFAAPGGQTPGGSSQSPLLPSGGPGDGSTYFASESPEFGVGSPPASSASPSVASFPSNDLQRLVVLSPSTVEVVETFILPTVNNVRDAVAYVVITDGQVVGEFGGYRSLGEEDSDGSDQSPPADNYGQGDDSAQIDAPPTSSYNSSPSAVAGPSMMSAPYLYLPPAAIPSLPGQSAGTTAHPPVASNLSDVGASLTFGINSGNQAGATQSSPAVVSPLSTPVDSTRPTAPNNIAPGVISGEVVTRGFYTEPLNADSILPLRERSPGDREIPLAPSSHYETSQSVAGSPASIGVEVESSAAPEATRDALLAGIATNFDIVDHALQAALEEIEKMGGDFVTWLDESNATTWAAGGAVVLLAGGGFYWQRRRATQRTEANQEEPSSWLFTHLYNPTGRS